MDSCTDITQVNYLQLSTICFTRNFVLKPNVLGQRVIEEGERMLMMMLMMIRNTQPKYKHSPGVINVVPWWGL